MKKDTVKKDTLEEIYSLYSRQVYLYALSLTKEHYTAEEMVSDTFYRALLSYDDRKVHIKAWLFTVCRNLFIDNYRRKKSKPTVEPPNDFPSLSSEPLQTYLKTEAERELYLAVLELEYPYREAIILHYYASLSCEEIGTQLSLTAGNTRTILYRARAKLKGKLSQKEATQNE